MDKVDEEDCKDCLWWSRDPGEVNDSGCGNERMNEQEILALEKSASDLASFFHICLWKIGSRGCSWHERTADRNTYLTYQSRSLLVGRPRAKGPFLVSQVWIRSRKYFSIHWKFRHLGPVWGTSISILDARTCFRSSGK